MNALMRASALVVCCAVVMESGLTVYGNNPHVMPDRPASSFHPSNTHPVAGEDRFTFLALADPITHGGPDGYGYTWDEVPVSWIDAVSGGTDAGLAGRHGQTGPLFLPFAFNFYGYTHTSVVVNLNGFLRFDSGSQYDAPQTIPSPAPPNNIIVPFNSSKLYLQADSQNGRIYYKAGGTAPNRFFVVQWNNVRGGPPEEPSYYDDTLLFQVVLRESGDILFQYQSMIFLYPLWCTGDIGIEDSSGEDGLVTHPACLPPLSNSAVLFHHPARGARIHFIQPLFGTHTAWGMQHNFRTVLRNTGSLGVDTFDFSVVTPSFGTATLLRADGRTLLTDSDNDGMPDTGPLAPGMSAQIMVRTETTQALGINEEGDFVLIAHSSINPSLQQNLVINESSTIRFALIFADNDGTLNLYLAHPAGQKIIRIAKTSTTAQTPSIAEMPDGNFFVAWSQSRYAGSGSIHRITEIYYIIVDNYGRVIRSLSKLTDLTGADTIVDDLTIGIAVASSGHVGLSWIRSAYRLNMAGSTQSNAYFAVLDQAGNVLRAPTPVTTHGFGEYANVGSVFAGSISIAVTRDNHFALAWNEIWYSGPQDQCPINFCSIANIYYSLHDEDGNPVKPPTRLTNDVSPGWEIGNYDPFIIRFGAKAAMLSYLRIGDYDDVVYVVLDSTGNLIKEETNATNNGTAVHETRQRTTELTNGGVVIGYEATIDNRNFNIGYVVMDPNLEVAAGPAQLSPPALANNSGALSVTSDSEDHAVLTWVNRSAHLCSSLVGMPGNSPAASPAHIFFTVPPGASTLHVSSSGYGNTTYRSALPADADAAIRMQSSVFAGAPNGIARIPIDVANYGTSIASSLVLTITLEATTTTAYQMDAGNLTYATDTSGITPTVTGNTVIWHLPNTAFLQNQTFTLILNVPAAPIGTYFDFALEVSVAGADANAMNNAGRAKVIVMRDLFMPLVQQEKLSWPTSDANSPQN